MNVMSSNFIERIRAKITTLNYPKYLNIVSIIKIYYFRRVNGND